MHAVLQSLSPNIGLHSQIRVCIFSRNNLCMDVNDAGEVSSITKKIERYNNNQYAQYSIVRFFEMLNLFMNIYIYIYIYIKYIYIYITI